MFDRRHFRLGACVFLALVGATAAGRLWACAHGIQGWLLGDSEQVLAFPSSCLWKARLDQLLPPGTRLPRGPHRHDRPGRAVRHGLGHRLARRRRGGRVDATRGADGLACLAYAAGNFKSAQDWLDRAPQDAPMTNWIRAKLLLRQGRLAAAAPLLGRAGREGGLGNRMQAAGDAGVVEVALERYAAALDHFRASEGDMDAAYVAERLMTTGELTAYVDRRAPLAAAANDPANSSPEKNQSWRDLLARRLACQGRFRAARRYLRTPYRPALDHGGFDRGGEPEIRPARQGGEVLWATFAARRRAERSRALPDQRFHYRFTAAGLARRAAKLLPDGTEEKARYLANAGSWIKFRDQAAALPLYRDLARCCGETPTGHAALAIHWFPEVDACPATPELPGTR